MQLILSPEDNIRRSVDFSYDIRRGNAGKVNEFLKNNSTYVLQAKLSTEIVTELNTPIQLREKPLPYYNHDAGNLRKAKLIILPIHIAIIAKQVEIVKTILEYVSSPTSDNNNKLEIRKILGTKTKVEFPEGQDKIYALRDRVLDGINAFHLAARFDAPSLDQIIITLNERKILWEFQDLWQAKDDQLERTPLHVAAKVADNCATR